MSIVEEPNLEPIDLLAFTTEELQGRLSGNLNDAEKLKIVQAFLDRWETDENSMKILKDMNIEFDRDLDWFNVSETITMARLQGKIVILDFFTYCCINCMHVLPELAKLEELFPVEKGLVVIGVHSPKFQNEKSSVNILSAAQRYGIRHPIVNDAHSNLWRSLGIRCWPSLLVLSPKGQPILYLMGEGHGKLLQIFVDQAIRHFNNKKEIQTFSLPLAPSTNLLPASTLRFPAKIARSESGNFTLADAGNNRILVFDKDGTVMHKIGGADVGFVDGNFDEARFNSPQGVVFVNDDVLIVADTENHALRKVHLSENRVETLAGTGQQGFDRIGGRLGPSQEISSPWDVAIWSCRDMDMSFHLDEQEVPEKTIILASMAGTHQIWGYFPEGMIWWKFKEYGPRTCAAIIGNGMEENRNNSYPQNAAFAQPSGLTKAQKFLFIADSESSSIRKVSMVDGKVMPVCGGDRNPLNLFAFGDIDGKQYSAKLQHPLGVTYNHVADKVYVADTYNHKIKVIDPATSTIETVKIIDENGALYKFNEPAGLCFDASCRTLLISDTNNHALLSVDMTNLVARPFVLDFSQLSVPSVTDAPTQDKLKLLRFVELSNCRALTIKFNFMLETNLKFTADAPQRWTLNVSNSGLIAQQSSGEIQDGRALIKLQRPSNTAASSNEHIECEELKLNFTLSLCDEKSCLMKRFSVILMENQTNKTSNGSKQFEHIEEQMNIKITSRNIDWS